jgi:hypothetical protein
MKYCNQEKVILQQAYENLRSTLNANPKKSTTHTTSHVCEKKNSTSPCFAVHLGAGNIVFIQRQLIHTVLYEPLYKGVDYMALE